MNLHDFWCSFKFSNKKNNSFAIKSLGLSPLCSEKIGLTKVAAVVYRVLEQRESLETQSFRKVLYDSEKYYIY